MPSFSPRPMVVLCALLLIGPALRGADPRISSWLTTYSGQYARIYETDSDKAAGTSKTTWSRGAVTQSLPAYCGLDEVSYSDSWVYLRTTGLASHIMGPWYLNAARSSLFPNLPANTKTLYRIPRSPAVPVNKTLTGLGTIGYFVDGVAMFDGRDSYFWNGSSEANSGTGYWNRDAYVNESITFDPGYAHQEQTGTYHYHADPIALRYLLGDHIDFDPVTKTYSESTAAPTKHSPILGWVRDGYPVYGPYGYSEPMNPDGGVRRMISGFTVRNGQNGTDNLSVTGRTSIPAWAVRAYGVSSAQSGPSVSTTYPLGRYMEDNAYLGDIGFIQGASFDLDEYNGRYCVTPEFPQGTYAYFITISANGTPVFPYHVARSFYGDPSGGTVTSISETVTTTFNGEADLQEAMKQPVANGANGDVTVKWSSVEGSTYQVDASTNLTMWGVLSASAAASPGTESQLVDASAISTYSKRFYRITRTALANYDPATGSSGGGGGGNGILSVSPTSGTRGSTVTVTINLDPSANPPPPPQNAPINSATIGTISGTSLSHLSQTQVRGNFTIPGNATTGAQTVTVVFPGPPGNPGATVTYTLTNGFTIQ